ncbi:MAG: hypothetical protein DI598_11220 [Pseudopedobacter saltans]|uniref:Uncharacterized protein n=1 Tax=Pseudopedobacter saltans TaxID=151895 RepID=A0A2W5GZI4_9SPHI|nr:MAG: hypothetical protein DI598_11220 [Pseudopedobacter saltans]
MVSHIDEIVGNITNNKELKSVTISDKKDKTLTGFYINDSIVKIVKEETKTGIDTTSEVFYFEKGKLIFVHESNKASETAFDGRYYFDNGKMIDYSTTGHNRFENDSLDPEKFWLKDAEKCQKILYQKIKKVNN